MDLQNNDESKKSVEISRTISIDITSMSKWMKFIGIFSIIAGAIYCLTCIGAIFGWFPIMIGVFLLKSADGFLDFLHTNSQAAFEEGIKKLKYYFTACGIYLIVVLALLVIYIAVFVPIIIVYAMKYGHDFNGLINSLGR